MTRSFIQICGWMLGGCTAFFVSEMMAITAAVFLRGWRDRTVMSIGAVLFAGLGIILSVHATDLWIGHP